MVGEGARVVIGDVMDDEGRALLAELGPSATCVHMGRDVENVVGSPNP